MQLDGPRGPLTAQQSQKIIENLKKNSADTNIFKIHLALEAEIVGSPLVVGNKVDLLVDGPSTYKSMFTAMESAIDHINMETYIIEDDEIGRQFIALLIRKQRSGVQVNLIYDSVGALGTPKEFFDPLKVWGECPGIQSDKSSARSQGMASEPARSPKAVDRGMGRSPLSVASTSAVSTPVDRFGKPARNQRQSAMARYPFADGGAGGRRIPEARFLETWSQQKGAPLLPRTFFPTPGSKGNEVVRAIGSSPEEPYSQIFATLLSAINSAETAVFLTNAYFVPDPQLLAALKEAVQRGVDVRLLLPEKTDSMMVFYASRSYYDELLSAGVKIYERQGALLHAKTALVDGVWSTVGSTNLDWRSFLHNQEINAVILGQDFGAQMHAMFEKDLESSKHVSLEKWRERSLGSLKEGAARLWARWL